VRFLVGLASLTASGRIGLDPTSSGDEGEADAPSLTAFTVVQ